MTVERSRWLDLVSEMHAAVWEQSPLHELPLATVDHPAADRKVVHGPWAADECRLVLNPWHEAGWLELIADVEPHWSLTAAAWQESAAKVGEFLVLSTDDAAALLNDPRRWVLGTADGHVMLSHTDAGQAREYSEWLALAEKAAQSPG